MGVSAVSGAVVPADTSTGLSTGPRHVFGAGNPAQVTTTNNPTESIARHLIQGSVQWIRRLVIKTISLINSLHSVSTVIHSYTIILKTVNLLYTKRWHPLLAI